MPCPCCSGTSYDSCCGPLLSGSKFATTAVALMRSRYTAFTKGDVDYLLSTMRERALKKFDPESTRQWAESVQWTGLQVIRFFDLGEGTAIVEFVASYKDGGKEENIHEVSEFKRVDGRWYYVGAKVLQRNDPCLCGSSKKYKHCCLKKLF